MNHLPLIIKREYLTKVKNKSFIVMTILSPIIMIALIALVAYLSQLNNDKIRTISILDESGLLVDVFKDTQKTKYNIIEGKNLEEAKEIVKEANQFGLLHIGKTKNIDELSQKIKFYSEDSPSFTLMTALESKIERQLTDLKLEREGGVDIEKIKSMAIDIDLGQESFSGEKTSKVDNIFKLIFGGLAGYMLFMFIIIYGNLIMRSVIEEKTSRIIEIIISSVKPVQLMLGKIIGTSLAGVTQFLIWIILGGFLLTLVSVIFGVNLMESPVEQQELVNQAMQNPDVTNYIEQGKEAFFNLPILNLIVAFIAFFIGGYMMYSSLYAAIGAAVDNETDTQQFLLPIIMPLIIAVYVGFFTVIDEPHGTVSVIFSYIPLTSPVVMLMRIPFGVPWWEQLLSFLILIATFMFVVWLAAKIYRVGILMYGKKPSYKELIKWIKY